MTINLSGELLSDDWAELYRDCGYESGFYCPADVRAAIRDLPRGEELVLEINSPGGNVDGGSEIYSLIQGCENPTRAVIQSIAASAASYMIMSCDRIEICLPAQMMVHKATGGGRGNETDHLRDAQMLHCTDDSILSCYVARCGEDKRDRLLELVANETFLTSAQAVELGLADAVVGGESQDSPMLAAECCRNIVRAMRVLPDISVLQKARQDDIAAKARLEAETAKARLELEAEIGRYWNAR